MTVRRFSLAHLTALDLTPPEMVATAAEAGYDLAGIRMLPASPGGPAYPLWSEPEMLRETQARIRDTGVAVFDLEIIRVTPDFQADAFRNFFEAGQAIGAKAILTAGYDPDESRMTASFAALCEAARPFGLSCDLEFMPWTEVPDARMALRIADAAGQPNGAVLVDALHILRSGSTPADVAAIPRTRLNYAQICDGPREAPADTDAMIYVARQERLLPGEGGADIAGIFGALPADLPISVEIPSVTRAPPLGHVGWAKLCLESSRTALANVAGRSGRSGSEGGKA